MPSEAASGREDGSTGAPQRDATGCAVAPADFASVLLILAVVSLLLLLSGCGLTDAHRAADRRFFEAVAPELQTYWASDPKLDKHQVERRERFLRTWKLFVETDDPDVQPEGDEELPTPKEGGPR